MAVDLSVLSGLVQNNVRLIIPTLGAFFVRDLNSGFRAENVTFSTFLRYDDGRLSELLEQSLGVSAAEASAQGVAICQYITEQLNKQGYCPLPGLGSLRKHQDGQIEFVAGDAGVGQEVRGDIVAEGDRMSEKQSLTESTEAMKQVDTPKGEAAKAKGSVRETVQSRAQAQRKQQGTSGRPVSKAESVSRSKPQPKTDGRVKSSGGGFVKFVLVLLGVVVVAGAADFLWFGWVSASLFPDVAPYLKVRTERELRAASAAVKVVENKDGEEKGDLGEEGVQVEDGQQNGLEEPSSLVREFKDRATGESGNESHKAQRESVASSQRKDRKEVLGSAARQTALTSGLDATSVEREYGLPSETNTYHVVVGSFTEKENASRFNRQLQSRGFVSGVIERDDGHNTVTVGSFKTRRAANVAREGMKDRFPDAWVLEY